MCKTSLEGKLIINIVLFFQVFPFLRIKVDCHRGELKPCLYPSENLIEFSSRDFQQHYLFLHWLVLKCFEYQGRINISSFTPSFPASALGGSVEMTAFSTSRTDVEHLLKLDDVPL